MMQTLAEFLTLLFGAGVLYAALVMFGELMT